MPVDDAARAPQSQFSRSSSDARERLEQALVQWRSGLDPTQVAESLVAEADLAELLEALDVTDTSELPPELVREALLQVAWLASERDDDELTLSAATKALSLEPADERALAIAEPLLLEREAFAELANRYAVAATSAGSEARARQLLERAIHMLADVPAATPALLGLTERLSRLSALREGEESLRSVLKSGGADAGAALVKLGERWLAEGRAREGVAALPSQLSTFRGDAALDVLERLFDQAEDLERLGQVLQLRVDASSSALARGRALEKLAAFQRERLADLSAAAGAFLAAAQAYVEAGEPDDAERAYERLLDMLPDHLNAAARLVCLRASAGNFAGVTEAFGVLLRADAAAARAGELLLSIVADAERASAAEDFAELSDNVLWRLAAEERELSQSLLRASARLFAAETRYDEAAELYRRLIGDEGAAADVAAYQALIDSNPRSDWRQSEQRWLFEWREHHCGDRPQLLLEWARFEERELGDPFAAANVLTRAAELCPERAEIWEGLLRLRLAAGDGAGALQAAGELRRLDRELDADALVALLEHDPALRWAVDRVKLALSAQARWSELFELYDHAIAATTDEPTRAAWLDEAAIAARDVAQDPERAIGYWQAYAELAPNDGRVDLALERLYEQTGDKAALIAHLGRRRLRGNVEQQVGLEERVARLCLQTADLAQALAGILRLQALGADSAEPLLESLFTRSAELWSDPAAREFGQKAAQILRQAQAERGQPEQVARLLRAELSLELDSGQRRERLAELSRLCERELSDLPAAFEVERESFLLTLAERERKRLEKLGKKLGRWSEICDTYAEAADSELGLDERRSLLRRAAELASAELRDPARARHFYERLFEVEPARAREVFARLPADAEPAFEALCSVLGRSVRFDELAQALEERARANAEPALWSRLGRLQADELRQPLAAIASHLLANDARAAGEVFLRQTSVFQQDGTPALELAQRLDRVGLPEGALRVLEHQLAFFGGQYPPERKPVQLALARALEASGATERAHDALADAAKHYPTDVPVQRAGAAAAVARQDWERAESCYRALLLLLHGAAESETSLRRSRVYVELASIKQQRKEPAAAEQLLESGFEAALDNDGELLALCPALLEHGYWPAAERAAALLLERGDDPRCAAAALKAVARLLEQGREQPADVLARARSLAEAAAGRLGPLATTEERSALLRASLAFLPLAESERLLAQAEPELSAEDVAQARLSLSRRALEEGDEAAREQAVARLQGLVSHPDAPAAAWQALVQAWELAGDTENLSATLDAWLERSPTNQQVLGRALELALSRGDAERALELYDRLARDGATPGSELSLRLCTLCASAGKRERAARLLRGEAEREPKPLKRAALLLEVSELLQAAGDAAGAAAAAGEAHALDPGSAEAALALAKLRLDSGDRRGAVALLDAYLESKERRRSKGLSRLLRLAADLRLEQDELSEALPLLVEAHQLDKTDLDTALLLGLLAVDLDRLETAASALRVLIAQRELCTRESAAARSSNLAQGYFQLARIEQHHGKKTNAKRMALRALEENPNLTPAQRLLDDLH
jgi:tetratricopeptide (TPR) repeat protein